MILMSVKIKKPSKGRERQEKTNFHRRRESYKKNSLIDIMDQDRY